MKQRPYKQKVENGVENEIVHSLEYLFFLVRYAVSL